MGILDKFKKRKEAKAEEKPIAEKEVKPAVKEKEEKPPEPAETPLAAEKPRKAKGKTSGDAYKILIKPLVTEKGTYLNAQNQYAFEVAPEANKVQIKKAIEELYQVTPVKVRVINVRGKQVRQGRHWGRRKNWKKAIVALKPGDKIEVYEGV